MRDGDRVRGPLVGLAGLSLYGDSAQSSDLNIGIYGNTFAGGGFDPIYGARPLKRVIQQKIENALA
ncbi:MAG TPA: hypothetical protein PLD23_19010, partial [Armatimonadota bacterium]|nr:hypothetical protein [Armatimonadota bacterium]